MLARAYAVLLDVVAGFLEDEALTRAAAIDYFALFSLGPLLFPISGLAGLAGLVFGEEQVRAALAAQLRGMVGDDAASAEQRMSVGALLGGWVTALLGFAYRGWIPSLVVSTLGAVLLLWQLSVMRRRA